ncbi:MAG: carboxypeptidase-like regulatory domain-containing protein [Acidobacteriota bacterium]|nr:carboxypeptidase-like regulatory domain-containing protein [Acidobacteriota bacterium]
MLAALLLSGPAALTAQTTFATITGTVTDSSGLPVSGAAVRGRETRSGYAYDAKTNDSGLFTLPNLREGSYEVTIAAAGFQESRASRIELASRQVRRLDVQLQIGNVATEIQVQASAAQLIETDTARISQSRTAGELRDLPLATRSITAFLSLVPGVGQATTVTATYRFNGSRRNQSEFTVDGISNVASNGTQISPLTNYIESFGEARIDSADNQADAGAIGQVTVVSKSGGNQVHGSLFDYYVTPAFRARDFFAPKRASGISHKPGGSIGGPVYIPRFYNGHNRTFFFFDYETSQGSISQQLINPTVPLAAWRSGDFSSLLPKTVVKDPVTNAPFPGNLIPASRLNPVALRIQNLFYPVPNGGSATTLSTANFITVLTHSFDPNTYVTGRLDHRFSEKALVYARYTWQRQYNTNFDANLPTVGQITDTRNTRNAVASWSQIITPNLVNELRFGFAFTNEPRHGANDGPAIVQQLGLTGLVPNQPDLPGIPNIAFTGLGLTTITQQAYRAPGFYNNNEIIQENLTWIRGKHTVHSGAQLGFYHANDVTASLALYGSLSFSNRFTGFAYSDFLLGLPSTSSRAPAPLDSPFLRTAYDFFVTDEWKFSPALTVNLGLRYELHPAWSSGNGLASLFDLASSKIVVQDGSLQKVNALLPASFVGVTTASQAGYRGAALIDTDKNNFAPRIGAAWRPFGEKTVFRAGFGIFYDIVPTSINMAGVPFTVNEPSYTNPAGSPVVMLPNVFPAAGVGGPSTISLPGAFKKDLRIPYSIQYNVTVERQIWDMGVRISYVGTGTRQGEYIYNINQPLPSTVPYVSKTRPYPAFATINYTTNGAGHQYNGLNTEVKRRLAKGLLYDFTWTYARDIGDLERDQSPEDGRNLHRERAVWADIPTHRITNDMIYQLPFGRGKSWLSHGNRALELLAGGWQIMELTAWNTGFFLTPLWQGPDPANVANTTSTTPATVTIRPDILHDPNLPASQRSTQSWYDPGAFAAPAPGYFGSSAKGVIVGPSSFIVNAGVAKQFNVSERMRLRLDFQGTNILNHANFDVPNLTITNVGSAGTITGTGNNGGGGLDASGARSFRLGLRVEW